MTLNADGVQRLPPRDAMDPAGRHLRDTYAITPGIPLVKREFGFYSLEAWAEQGMPQDVSHASLFDLDPPGKHSLGQLGWCEAGLCPVFETEVLEDRGDYELVRDFAGRHVLYFKGRRDGFMPEYVDHPVKDQRTFEEQILWRMDPESPGPDHRSRGADGRCPRCCGPGVDDHAGPRGRLHVPAQPDRPRGAALRLLRHARGGPRVLCGRGSSWRTP